MAIRDILTALLVPLIWGANIAVIKTAVAEFPPLFLTALRFLIVALCLIWWFPVPKKQLPMIMLLGTTFGSIHFGGIFYGLRGVDVSIVAILTLMGVPCSVVFARVILHEHFSRRKVFGMLIAFVGVFILFGEPNIAANPLHLTLVIIGVLTWGYGNTIIKIIGSINPMVLNAWMGLFASIPLFTVSALVESGQFESLRQASLRGWGCLLFLAFVTTIGAYGLWYYLIGKYDVTRIVPFSLLVPVAGVGTGVLVMGDLLTSQKIIGGLLTLVGVAVIQLGWNGHFSSRQRRKVSCS